MSTTWKGESATEGYKVWDCLYKELAAGWRVVSITDNSHAAGGDAGGEHGNDIAMRAWAIFAVLLEKVVEANRSRGASVGE